MTQTPSKPPRLIHTMEGGREAAAALERAGVGYGMRSSSSRPPPNTDVAFVDYPFRETWGFPAHFGAVREHRPTIAVAPDISGDRTPEHVYQQADKLADLEGVDHVVIVPKSISPTDVPDRFRVGLPFAQQWSELAVSVGSKRMAEYALVDQPIHILGGNPTAHTRLPPKIKQQTASLDTSIPLLKANFGAIWIREGWIEVPDSTLYWRLEATCRNMMRYWGHDIEPLFNPPQGLRDFFTALYGLRGQARVDEIRQQIAGRGPPVLDPSDWEGDEPGRGRGIPAWVSDWVDREMQKVTDADDDDKWWLSDDD